MSHWIVGNAAVPPKENAIAPNAETKEIKEPHEVFIQKERCMCDQCMSLSAIERELLSILVK